MPGDAPDREYTVRLGSITPQFFAAMGIPLLAGRTFVATDLPEDGHQCDRQPRFAERLLGGGDVIGRRLQLGDDADDWYTVVGVAGDARSAKVDTAAEPIVYLPYTHLTLPFMRLLVRGTGAEAATTEALVCRGAGRGRRSSPSTRPRHCARWSPAPPPNRGSAAGSSRPSRPPRWRLAVLGLYSLVSYTVSGRDARRSPPVWRSARRRRRCAAASARGAGADRRRRGRRPRRLPPRSAG